MRIFRPLAFACVAATALACNADSRMLTPPDRPEPSAAALDSAARVLASDFAAADGRGFIGFREAGHRRGVDPEGRVLVSAGTVARMRAYVQERGFMVEGDGGGVPYVFGRFPVVHEAQLRTLLAHPNVDYIEAEGGGGERHGTRKTSKD